MRRLAHSPAANKIPAYHAYAGILHIVGERETLCGAKHGSSYMMEKEVEAIHGVPPRICKKCLRKEAVEAGKEEGTK